MLEEGVGDHCHERMPVKAGPGSSLEVVEAEFLLQLLVGLLADPSRLDRGRQGAQIHPSWQVGKVVFLLARCPVLADEPGFVARKMLLTLVPYPLRRPVGLAAGSPGVPLARLIDLRHELTALIKSELHGGGNKVEGRAALITRQRLDDFFFHTEQSQFAGGNVADLDVLKRAITLETLAEQ